MVAPASRHQSPELDALAPAPEPLTRRKSGLVPSASASLFVILVLLLAIGRANALLNGDGDLARHLRVGTYILARRALFYQDVFSYTMLGKPFVPYEWLSEVLYTLANLAGGLAGVVVLASLVIGTTYALVTRFLIGRSVDPLLAFAVGALAAAASALHWLARPHLFSALGAIVTLMVLDTPGRRRLWPIVPIFVLWANLHGGFLFGLVLIATFLTGDVVELAVARDQRRGYWREHLIFHAKALGLAVAACLVNPSGPRLFAHVTGYLGQRYLVDHTQEYMSPDFHVFSAQIFIGVLLFTMIAFSLGRRRPSLPHLLVVAIDLAFALYSVRNIPLFAVTALPLVALEFDPTWRTLLQETNGLAIRMRRIGDGFARGERRGVDLGWPAATAVLLVGVAAFHGTIWGAPVIDARFDPARFPVAAIHRARAANLTGHLFNDFAWGGYILYAWPEQKVFIDGQTDFYGEALTRTYAQIADLDPGWRDALRTWGITLVVVPAESRLAAQLEREPGWSVWYKDKTAVILRYSQGNG